MLLIDKDYLRKKMIKLRRNILNKDVKSNIIVNKIINLDIYKNSKVIALYKSLDNQVNLDYLIKYSQYCGKIVLLPKVVGNKLLFIKYHLGDKLEKSYFKVLEPSSYKENIYRDKIDLIIIPGLSFDKDSNRLGYGKGYYDRFLKKKNIYKIGVCYFEQLIDYVPINNNDIKMDLVINEKT